MVPDDLDGAIPQDKSDVEVALLINVQEKWGARLFKGGRAEQAWPGIEREAGRRCDESSVAIGGNRLIVEANPAHRARAAVVAALTVRLAVVIVVVQATQATNRGDGAVDLQRLRLQVDRATRASTSGALLVVTVVATAAGTAATEQPSGQLRIAVARTPTVSDARVLPETTGSDQRVASPGSARRHATVVRTSLRRAGTEARVAGSA